jgi:tetratricopeptide (TPR) repeat protein
MTEYRKIIDLYENGNYENCIERIDKYLQKAEFNYEARFYKAKCFYSLKKYNEAIQILEKLVDTHPTKEMVLASLGNIYFKCDDLGKSKHYYEEVIKINRYSIEANFYLGRIYFELKNYNVSIDFLNKAEDYTSFIKDTGFNVFLHKANAFLELEEYEKAKIEITYAVKMEPFNYYVYFVQGLIFMETKEFGISLESFKKALELNPKDYISYYEIGSVHYSLKEMDTALKYLNKSLSLSPEFIPSLYLRALCFFTKKEFDKSLSDCLDYIKAKGTGDKDIYLMTGNNYFYLKDFCNASKYLEVYVEIKPDDCEAIVRKGVSLFELKEYYQAIDDFNKCIEVDPKFVKSYEYRGYCFMMLDEYEKAYVDFSKAIELGSIHKGVFHNRGLINLEKEKNVEAFIDFIKAKELGDATAEKLIENLCEIIGYNI